MGRYNTGFSRAAAVRQTARAATMGALVDYRHSLGPNPQSFDSAIQAADDGWYDTSLVQIVEARKFLDALEASVVRGARRHGMTWTQLGDLLHISKQAATKKFSHLDAS